MPTRSGCPLAGHNRGACRGTAGRRGGQDDTRKLCGSSGDQNKTAMKESLAVRKGTITAHARSPVGGSGRLPPSMRTRQKLDA
eukprot:2993729-Rhodomonas_salina.1